MITREEFSTFQSQQFEMLREIRDYQREQNGSVAKAVADIATLSERTASMKDAPARWLSTGSLLTAALSFLWALLHGATR